MAFLIILDTAYGSHFRSVPSQFFLFSWALLMIRFSRYEGWKKFGLEFDNGCLAEGHTGAAMCVKWWLSKFYLQILKSVTCLGLFNIEEFYQGSRYFGCFCWNFSNISSICCTYQNLYFTFPNVIGFFLNFSTSWKSCAKTQRPKKYYFHICWLNVMICNLRQKWG